MKLSRRHRLLTALAVLFSVLFTQLAVAAYACPGSDPAGAVAAALKGAANDCCGDMGDRDLPTLCKAHCQADEQSADRASQPLPALQALAAVLPAVIGTNAMIAAPPPGEQSSLLERPTAPPMAVRHCCFRI